MPSFTEDYAEPHSETAVSPPVSGTGLDIPSLRKVLHASGTSPGSPPDGTTLKQRRASIGRKTFSRPTVHQLSPMPSLSGQSSARLDTPAQDEREQSTKSEEEPQSILFNQVYDWLQHEKTRRRTHRARRSAAPPSSADDTPGDDESGLDGPHFHGSDSAFSLAQLEKILAQYANSRHGTGLGGNLPVRRPTRRRTKGLRRGSASESDATDVEAGVPSVDAFLDNSKTLGYGAVGAAEDDGADSNTSTKRAKDREAWLTFKTEIVRIAHTLRLKGWRKVPMEAAGEIEVVRLSGALTNAVYVVKPPKPLPVAKTENGSAASAPRRPPPKLLLRVYGPQVNHLIDREKELQILRRLGRKNIGPRVLGSFLNGRFEEYFEARPLTPRELRLPETAKQIAKRMRELHMGIELLDEEREGGPMIFINWDNWVDRCERVTTWLDKEIQSPQNEAKAGSEPWRRRGFVCGVPWGMFRKAVDNYRVWLIASCGGMHEIKRQLVFAHNDTQYGNLLRLEPSTESPLLLPANEHKQLVVIDFEYSSANTPGLEFANHFTEWCYNYHDEERSWACNNRIYPTPDEQYRFVSTYLTHRPGVPGAALSPLSTPYLRGRSATAITPLDLDEGSDGPNWQQSQTETPYEDDLDAQARHLIRQTRLWRVMNSAQWVAWGIVQAKVPGIDEGIAEMAAASSATGADTNGQGDPTVSAELSTELSHAHDGDQHNANGTTTKMPPVDADIDEGEAFDYLAYAQDRAMFFWSDLLALNLVNENELPAPIVEHIKSRMLEY